MNVDLHMHTSCSDGVYTPEELIAMAETARLGEISITDHVIPVPTMELKSHFRGYLLGSIRSFFKKKNGRKSEETYERSVVRPVFSYYGKLTFTDDVLQRLIHHTLTDIYGIAGVNKVKVGKSTQDVGSGIDVTLSVTILYGENVRALMHQVKDAIQHGLGVIRIIDLSIFDICCHIPADRLILVGNGFPRAAYNKGLGTQIVAE